MEDASQDAYGDLKKKTFSSAIWSVVRVLWMTGATFVVFVLLARILGPEDFGLFALASLFLEVGRIFTNAGLGDAVIRQPVLEEELADTAFWSNLTFALIVAAVIILFAPVYAGIVNHGDVTNLLRALALTLPVAALSTIHGARLARDYRHRLFAVQAGIGSAVSGAAGVGAALAGFGVWSLVVQAWASVLVSLALMWFALPWVPKLRFSRRAFKDIAGFSFSTTANQLVWLLMGRAGDLLISRALGVAELGRYRIAWRMYELIGQVALAPIGGIAMLTFSKLQGDTQKLRAAYNRMVGLSSVLAFPLLLGYAALAPEIIEILFSSKWEGVGQISQILALMLIPYVFNYVTPSILMAINKPAATTKVAVVQLVSSVVLTWISLPWGLAAVAAGYVLKTYLVMPYLLYQVRKHANVSVLAGIRSTVTPLILSAVMALAVWLARPLLHDWTGSTWGVVIGGVILGGAIYGAGVLVFARRQIEPVLELGLNAVSGVIGRRAR